MCYLLCAGGICVHIIFNPHKYIAKYYYPHITKEENKYIKVKRNP